ncbi:MAG: GNAT family N-acetyltransferase [Desulfovibrionaceae bacterium]|jgi:ribosomal protein S18 acetylase RimI-like enzyme
MNIQHCSPIMGISFRTKVHKQDIDNVRAIVESSTYFNDMEVEMAVEIVYEHLADPVKSTYRFLFAETNGESVGYACFGPIEAAPGRYDLYWIAVLNEYRGLGIGRELLAATEEAIRRDGGRLVYVETSSKDQYYPTREFYRKNGYEQEAVVRDFYADGDDKLIYVKDVPPRVSGR